MGVIIQGDVVEGGGFMLSDPIGGNDGSPLVDEGKVGLEEGIGSRGWNCVLMAKVSGLFVVDSE